jgi:hypothetical protein
MRNRLLSTVLLALALCWTSTSGSAQTRVGGRIIEGLFNYCADAGGTDAYACNFSPAIGAYVTGAVYSFKANTVNTGACTLALNGLAATAIKVNGTDDPTDGTIAAGEVVTVRYDGTNMQLQSGEGGGSPGNDSIAQAELDDNADTSAGNEIVFTNGATDFKYMGLVGGASGGITTDLTVDPATVDIVTAVVPTKSAANAFTGAHSFQSTVNFCADAGGTDTYACSISPAISSLTTGACYHFSANTANTGAATINFNSIGAKAIKTLHDQDPSDNDIEAGQMVTVCYDGTNMQMQSQVAAASGPSYVEYYLPAIARATGSNDYGADWHIPASGGATTGASTYVGYVSYANAADQEAVFVMMLPANWTGGAITLTFTVNVGSGGGAAQTMDMWTRTGCVTAGESLVPSWNTIDTTNITSTANNVVHTLQITPSVTNCAAGELMYGSLNRDDDGAGDDDSDGTDGDSWSGSVQVIGVAVRIPVS